MYSKCTDKEQKHGTSADNWANESLNHDKTNLALTSGCKNCKITEQINVSPPVHFVFSRLIGGA